MTENRDCMSHCADPGRATAMTAPDRRDHVAVSLLFFSRPSGRDR